MCLRFDTGHCTDSPDLVGPHYSQLFSCPHMVRMHMKSKAKLVQGKHLRHSMTCGLTCKVCDLWSSNGARCSSTIEATVKIISMTVNWKYASRAVANTCAKSAQSACSSHNKRQVCKGGRRGQGKQWHRGQDRAVAKRASRGKAGRACRGKEGRAGQGVHSRAGQAGARRAGQDCKARPGRVCTTGKQAKAGQSGQDGMAPEGNPYLSCGKSQGLNQHNAVPLPEAGPASRPHHNVAMCCFQHRQLCNLLAVKQHQSMSKERHAARASTTANGSRVKDGGLGRLGGEISKARGLGRDHIGKAD